jgi:hypothetical protein
MLHRVQFVPHTQVDDELHNLQTRDVLLPPDADAAGALEVVPVHNYMDQQVDGDGHPLHRSQADQLGVAEEGRGAVVVGVEEGQGLLLEEEEDGVYQFEVFGEVVQLRTLLVIVHW